MSLSALAGEISKHANILDSYITTHNLPVPSFDADGPLDFPIPSSAGSEIHTSRTALLEASKALYDLTAGPAAAIAWPALTYPYELLTLRALYRFRIPEAVPLAGEATFPSIAAMTGIDEDFITRIIKHACASNIFRETSKSPSTIVHTAGSRALLENKLLRNCLETCLDDGFQAAAAKADEAVVKYGGVSESNQTAFNIAFGTDEDYLSFVRRPDEKKRLSALSGCLKYVMMGTAMGVRYHDTEMLVRSGVFDWEGVGEGLVVDVGGAHGNVSASIARKYPKLRFIVQDRPSVIASGKESLLSTAGTPEIASRISFMAHDFLTPQPVKDADVFLFRFVIHDWSDRYVIAILRNLLPAMKKSTRIIIMDYLLPEPNTVPKVVEKMERSMDLAVMALVAGKERSRKDWACLVEKTHSNLRIVNIEAPADSAFGVVEIAFDGEENKA